MTTEDIIQERLKVWKDGVDQLFINRGIHPTQHKKIKIIETLHNTFTEAGWYNHSKYGDGLVIFDVLNDPDCVDASFLQQNKRTSMYELIPALKENQTWKYMLPRLNGVRQKGYGIGELLLTLILCDSRFSYKKDLTVGTQDFECKKLDGGCMKATPDASFRITDEARNKYLDGKSPYDEDHSPSALYNFYKTVYPHFSDTFITGVVEKLRNGGACINVKSDLGKEIYKSYQKIDGFAGILLIGDSPALEIISVIDVEDTQFMTDNVAFTPQTKRGGDTNAVGDGYCKIRGINIKKRKNK